MTQQLQMAGDPVGYHGAACFYLPEMQGQAKAGAQHGMAGSAASRQDCPHRKPRPSSSVLPANTALMLSSDGGG